MNRDGADTKAPDMWGWGYALKACFSPDGKRLAVVRDVGRIELWDVAAGKIRHSLTYDGYGRASLLAFSPDGARLASASGDLWGGDNRIRVWDAVKGRELYPNAGHGAPIASLAISPAGATVATAGQDGAVHVWDYRTGKHVMRLDGGRGRAPHVSFSGDGGRVIWQGGYRGDSALRIWAADTGRAVTRVDLPNAEAYWTAVTPDGRTAFAVDLKAKAGRTYDLITGKLAREDTTAAYFENSPRSVSPRGDAIVNMSGRLLTGADRKERLQVGSVFTQNYSAEFTADGRRLVAAVSKKRDFDFRTEPPAEEIVVIDPVAGRELRRFDAVGGTAGAINAAAVSPDGKTVVTVADAGPEAEEQIVTLWEAETGRPRGRFRGHIGPVKSVAVSGDGRFIVTGGADTTALVWDAAKPLAMSSAARRRPAGADAKACLNDLAGADAEQAYASLRALIDAPKETVAFLAGQPALFARADGAAVHRLIRELNSDAYAGRERAARDLGLIADDAESYLRQALRGDVSAEARRRIDGLLAAQRDGFTGPGLQKVRVIEVLEHVAAATGDTTRMAAAALLTKLAAAPETRLTQEATAALARLGRQADGKR